MLLVSNLVLWENIVSASIDTSAFVNAKVSLKDIFDDAITISKSISDLATELGRLFVSISLVPVIDHNDSPESSGNAL